jgi:broad specificity phosphatase PhoE
LHVFVCRHAEAVKNQQASFASAGVADDLTDGGTRDASAIARNLSTMVERRGIKIQAVLSSASLRSVRTAEVIAGSFGCLASASAGLDSIRSGVLAGVPEADARRTHPEYMRALSLYRAGLFNSYNIPEFEGKEDKRAFERRVVGAFSEFTAKATGGAIVVAQRSSITAILIHCARQSGAYPSDFFGHVQLDLGHVSWLSLTAGRWSIQAVNRPAAELVDVEP